MALRIRIGNNSQSVLVVARCGSLELLVTLLCRKFDNLITARAILIFKERGNVLLVQVRHPCPLFESVVYLTGQFYVYHCPK